MRSSSPTRTISDGDRDGLPELLDVEGVATALGVNPRYVRRLVAERRIPFIKWGRYLRFDPAELSEWLDEARVAADNPRSSASRRAG